MKGLISVNSYVRANNNEDYDPDIFLISIMDRQKALIFLAEILETISHKICANNYFEVRIKPEKLFENGIEANAFFNEDRKGNQRFTTIGSYLISEEKINDCVNWYISDTSDAEFIISDVGLKAVISRFQRDSAYFLYPKESLILLLKEIKKELKVETSQDEEEVEHP